MGNSQPGHEPGNGCEEDVFNLFRLSIVVLDLLRVNARKARRTVGAAAICLGVFAFGASPAGADSPKARMGLRAAASLDPYFLSMGGHFQTGRAAGFSIRLMVEGGLGEGFALGGGAEVLWYAPVTRRLLTPYAGIESYGLAAVGGTAPSRRGSSASQGTSGWYTLGGPGAIVGMQHESGRFLDVRVALIRQAPSVRVVYGRTWGDTSKSRTD